MAIASRDATTELVARVKKLEDRFASLASSESLTSRRASCYATATQTFTSGTFQARTFYAAYEDSGGFFPIAFPTTAPIVIPADGAGWYSISASLSLQAILAGTRAMSIDDITSGITLLERWDASPYPGAWYAFLAGDRFLPAGARLSLSVYQDSGGPITDSLISGYGSFRTFPSMTAIRLP
jgi:hypothetical protein